MLHWAAVFFVIAVIAAIFGFGGIAASAREDQKDGEQQLRDAPAFGEVL